MVGLIPGFFILNSIFRETDEQREMREKMEKQDEEFDELVKEIADSRIRTQKILKEKGLE